MRLAILNFLNDSRHSEPRRGEILLGLAWAVGTLLFSDRVIGGRLFLVYLYGWKRVWDEHLRILEISNRTPWMVSNGDIIREGFFIEFLISGACWFALFFASYPLLRLLLPRAKKKIE